jgi:hypothetical protein
LSSTCCITLHAPRGNPCAGFGGEPPVHVAEERPVEVRAVHQLPSKRGGVFVHERVVGAAEVGGLHADRLRLCLRLDRAVEVHRPLLVQQLLGHAVRERGAVGERARVGLRVGEHALRLDDALEEAPRRALVGAHRASGVEQVGRAPLPDHARQQRARAHVGAGQAHAHEQERRPRARRAEADVGSERDHRARARAHAVDGRDDRLRAMAHRLDEVAGHAREVDEARVVHRRQRADDLVHVAAGAEVAAGAGDDDRAHVARVDEPAEQVAQLRVRVERQRVLARGQRQRDRRDLAVRARLEAEVTRAIGRAPRCGASARSCGSSVAVVPATTALSLPSSACRRSRSSALSPAKSSITQRSCATAMASKARAALAVRRTICTRRSPSTAPALHQALVHELAREAGDVAAGHHQAPRQFLHAQSLRCALELREVVEARERDAEAVAKPAAHGALDHRRAGDQPQPQAQRVVVRAGDARFMVRAGPGERGGHGYDAVSPPSITIVCPFTERDSGRHSHATAEATSTGAISRFCGLRDASALRASASLRPVRATMLATASRTMSVSA